MQGEGGSKLQIRCRLILLISEHPIQQGIRKVKSSLLANLRSSLVANYWTVRKCLFSMCFSPFSAIFFAFTPFKYTHNTNFEKKCSPGLDFLSTVKAQTFCRNSGRVATAYSTDKYKYQNMKIRVSWVGQSSRKDLNNNETLRIPERYSALLFITDKLSSPDNWFM